MATIENSGAAARSRQSAGANQPASTFADRIAALAAPLDGLSGFLFLPDAKDSFAARVLLARHAQRSLELQYYIWSGDQTGMMMLSEMLDAARRGVKVRLLLDDHGSSGLDQFLSALEAEPNIEIRPFNRFGWRAAKLAGFLFDFARDVARDGTSRDGAGYRAI